jgi:PTS system fructose-specific IIC component
MKIRDLLAAESIELNGKVTGKKEALDAMVDLMAKSGKINDVEVYRKGVYAREEESTTGIGEGIAIPHCKSDSVSRPGLAAMVVPEGVDFDSLDGEKVNLIFLIAAPNTKENVHLDVLSKLSVLLMDEDFTANLRNAKTVDEFLHVIDAAEAEKDAEEEKKEEEQKAEAPASNGKLILAVTGCPTGIAHTYMAAEALEKKAKELGYRIKVETRGSGGAKNVLTKAEIAEAECILGYRIKVETRGSGGAKNVLTKAEIAEAECIIVAADTQVPMDRFAGKPVIQCKVADGISKAEELLTKAANGHASIYEAGGKAADDEEEGKDSLGHQIYKHLMNGVSHMLPFVVGGGILIAIAFLIDGFSVDLNSLPLDQRSNFGTITPMAAMFKSIGGVAFGFMLPILAGFIAMSIADRPGLAVGFVGGAIAANGTSGFLGALAAGFLAGYIVLLLKKICSKLPDSLEGTKPVLIYPLLGIFMIGVLMTYVVEPPIGALNTLINNGLNGLNGASAILLGALLGGMMSVDMGGPVNKAAYVFGTASITAGNYNIMAAVMVGGMVPPIAIALATLIFKNKFTADERKAGPTNFIMGLSFITEGAIPFAASDPLHVLPACVVGSAAAGALSMAFNCTLMAPHGGIFVFLTVGNPLLYLVALAVGSAVGCVLLGVLKKKTA